MACKNEFEPCVVFLRLSQSSFFSPTHFLSQSLLISASHSLSTPICRFLSRILPTTLCLSVSVSLYLPLSLTYPVTPSYFSCLSLRSGFLLGLDAWIFDIMVVVTAPMGTVILGAQQVLVTLTL